ncbi:MAG: NAD(P)-dependent oxidoreductase [Sphingomonas bacterium]|uniref:NAD(P)-dependent oxidoreductase n=1 Tax=Sphingomonas bacterium TaxID=1895847 RepID=UPI0026270C6F|nr:NAD(P)-dependent oxidoreductase [Sphingomonas bacterium]MDB5711843.1 NAD(P)-dependent oxidoreductase [Sphingomonas bacterium]
MAMARNRLLILGAGYAAGRIGAALGARGWNVTGVTRDGREGTLAFGDRAAVTAAIAAADAVLSSIPPEGDIDPALKVYGVVLAPAPGWLGYLSSTGVYGDAGGAWVDETAPTGTERRNARSAADAAWLARGARVFRLPGIYGPGRSPLDRVAAGTAHRVEAPGQVFSRVHVDDIVSGVIAGLDAPAEAYNLADDYPCAQNEVIAFAAGLLGRDPPPLVSLDTLSPMARAFYAENRRVANGKAKRLLGWAPLYADYRLGLRAVRAMTSPAPASAAPAMARPVQR